MAKTNRLPKLMNNGERAALLADFRLFFPPDRPPVTAEALVLWASNNRQWYEWHFTRFKEMVGRLGLEKCHPKCQPGFMEYVPRETVSARYSDWLRGLMNQAGIRHYGVECDAGRALYLYYYNHYLESFPCKTSPSSETEAP